VTAADGVDPSRRDNHEARNARKDPGDETRPCGANFRPAGPSPSVRTTAFASTLKGHEPGLQDDGERVLALKSDLDRKERVQIRGKGNLRSLPSTSSFLVDEGLDDLHDLETGLLLRIGDPGGRREVVVRERDALDAKDSTLVTLGSLRVRDQSWRQSRAQLIRRFDVAQRCLNISAWPRGLVESGCTMVEAMRSSRSLK